MMSKNVNKLLSMLGMSSLNGSVTLAAVNGMFKVENAFAIAILLIAGPAAVLIAAFSEGEVWQRIITALASGFIATILVVIAAVIGPRLLDLVNIEVIKIFGGISVLTIGLIITGMKIPDSIPTIIMATGIVVSILMR